MSDLELSINGWKYSGWTSMQITRGIENLAHSFSVTLTDRWENDGEDIPIRSGDACTVSLGDQLLTNGYVDDDGIEYDATNRSLTCQGRSATSDLVDCSVAGSQFKGLGLLAIAKRLCSPFDISVSTNVDLGSVFRVFELQDGETVFQALQRAAQRRGVLLLTKADGSLIFDRVGSVKVKTKLVYGRNILRGSRRRSWRDRFSNYTVKSQSSGTDDFFGKSASSISRSSTDSAVTRHRPITIMADDEDSGSELQKRVDWERNVRAGRSDRVGITVQGWEHDGGLWDPNTIVSIEDKILRLNTDLLIVETVHSRNEQDGSITTLSLTMPEAFDVQPLPPPKKKSGSIF